MSFEDLDHNLPEILIEKEWKRRLAAGGEDETRLEGRRRREVVNFGH